MSEKFDNIILLFFYYMLWYGIYILGIPLAISLVFLSFYYLGMISYDVVRLVALITLLSSILITFLYSIYQAYKN